VSFASGDESSVEVDQGLIPSEGGRERCGIKGAPQAPPAAGDVALAFVFSTIVVKGSKAGKRGRLFATDTSELGHADDERERGPFANARNAQHEIEAGSQIVVTTYLLGNEADLSATSCLQTDNVAEDYASQSRLGNMFEPGLQPRDILFDLLDEGQKIGKVSQPLIRLDRRLLHHSCASCNQSGIEHIVLGSPKMSLGEGTHLDGLQNQDCKACLPQMPDHATFIASRCLNPHAFDLGLGQLRAQTLPTLQIILNAPMSGLPVKRDIELVFGRINAGHCRASLRHLRRSLPC